jgi:hypothetical protein
LLQKFSTSSDFAQIVSFTGKPFVKVEDIPLPIPAKKAYAIAFELGHFRRLLLG